MKVEKIMVLTVTSLSGWKKKLKKISGFNGNRTLTFAMTGRNAL